VYKTYTEFEANTTEDMDKARQVYERGVGAFKDAQQNEQRAMLFEYWLKTEKQNLRRVNEQLEQAKNGEIDMDVEGVELLIEDAEEWVEKVKKRHPQKVKKQRRLADIDGQPDYEEYIDYVFPDDEENKKKPKSAGSAPPPNAFEKPPAAKQPAASNADPPKADSTAPAAATAEPTAATAVPEATTKPKALEPVLSEKSTTDLAKAASDDKIVFNGGADDFDRDPSMFGRDGPEGSPAADASDDPRANMAVADEPAANPFG